jgi:hypothetical protein
LTPVFLTFMKTSLQKTVTSGVLDLRDAAAAAATFFREAGGGIQARAIV